MILKLGPFRGSKWLLLPCNLCPSLEESHLWWLCEHGELTHELVVSEATYHVSICEILFKEGAGRNQTEKLFRGSQRKEREWYRPVRWLRLSQISRPCYGCFCLRKQNPEALWGSSGLRTAPGRPQGLRSLLSQGRAARSSRFLPTPALATLLITNPCPLFTQATFYVKLPAPLHRLANWDAGEQRLSQQHSLSHSHRKWELSCRTRR